MDNQMNYNYVGSLQELCCKLKLAEINEIYTDLGVTMCINNRNLFKIEARVRYAGEEFVGSGESYRKKDAKGISAKFCLIKFVAYLRANEHPQIRPEDYGLTADDLTLSTDPKLHLTTTNDSGLSLCSLSSSSSSEAVSNRATATDLTNSLSAIQAYVNNQVTYKKEANPFVSRSVSSPSTPSTSDQPKLAALQAKPSNSVQIPFSSMKLNSEEEEDGGRVLQLNAFRTKRHSEMNQCDQTDEQRPITNSPSRPVRDELNGRDYIVGNYTSIQELFNRYNLLKGLSYAVLLYKLVQQLPELSTEFLQKTSNERVISYQKVYFKQCTLITVFSEKPVNESVEDCSLRVFNRLLLDFKLS